MEKLHFHDFQGRLGRIEELIRAIDTLEDNGARARVRELVQTLLELHGAGIERMLEITDAAGPDGETVINKMARDDLVSHLLLLHGLHPVGLETRVRQALETVRPRLGLHGGSVELLSITPAGEVKLRLEGNCHGCPSSRVTLQYSIQEAIYAAAPDVTALEVEGAVDQANSPGAVAAAPKFSECPLPQEALAKPKKEQIA